MAISLGEVSFAVECCWAALCYQESPSWGFDPAEYPVSPALCREWWCCQDSFRGLVPSLEKWYRVSATLCLESAKPYPAWAKRFRASVKLCPRS